MDPKPPAELVEKAREVFHYVLGSAQEQESVSYIMIALDQHARAETRDLIDTIEAMLNAAGWDGTLESLNAESTKPSHFIAARVEKHARTELVARGHVCPGCGAVAHESTGPDCNPTLTDEYARAEVEKATREKQEQYDKLMAMVLVHTRLCPFGRGLANPFTRTACVDGVPGCACNDEVERLRPLLAQHTGSGEEEG
jgi:hypothetical protein